MATITAQELRKAFRAIPEEQRDARKSFSVRVWRALSWLERSESCSELEDRFITLWISFNAIYGQLDEEHRPCPDRETWQGFLARIWALDGEGQLRHLLWKHQLPVLKLIETRWLAYEFWIDPEQDHDARLRREVRELLPKYGRCEMLPVLLRVFDRIYVLRLQVFHGASTKGSALNRRTLTACTSLLGEFVPVIISVVIARGVDVDWGRLCFPPVETPDTMKRRAAAKAGR